MPGPKDITNSLVDWEKKNQPGKPSFSDQTEKDAGNSHYERPLAFDGFSWFIYSMLFTFLGAQLLLMTVFDLF